MSQKTRDIAFLVSIWAVLGLFCLALAGCSDVPNVPAKLSPPSARLMAAAEPLPDVKAGDDLVQINANLRAQYGRETGKLSSLQKYVRTILKK